MNHFSLISLNILLLLPTMIDRRFFFFFSFFLSTLLSNTSAGTIQLSLGVNAGVSSESEQKNTEGKKIVRPFLPLGQMGTEAGIDYKLLGPLGLMGAIQGSHIGAKVEYDYTNSTDPLRTRYQQNIRCKIEKTTTLLGARLRILPQSFFTLFAGGGIQLGTMDFHYNSSDYIKNRGDEYGFNKNEKVDFNGYFIEVGMEVGIKLLGMRVLLRGYHQESDIVQTLGQKEITFKGIDALWLGLLEF